MHNNQSAAPPSPQGGEVSLKQLFAPLLAVIIGTFMVILDSTVVNVAIPTLVEYFDASLQSIQWSVTAYTLALSAVIPLAGWMSDQFQAKRVFLASIGLFTAGSILCAFAQTTEQLIFFRVLQGIGGGMVSPIGMAMVYRLAPASQRGSVIGMFGIPMLLAPALGPVLSGWLVEYVTWQWIFLINLPIGIAGIVIGRKWLPSSPSMQAPSLDMKGMILGPLAFSMITFGVSEGGVSWTSGRTLTGLVIGGLSLILFVISCLRHRQPLLELRVFRSADFARGIVISWVMQTALFGTVLLFPLLLQQMKQYTPLETGLIMLPQALGSMICMPIAGKIFDKVGARPPLLVGMTLITGALFTMSCLTLDTSLAIIMSALFLLGSGMGLSMMALNTHVLNATPRDLVGRVTPLTSASQQVVSSFAIAGFTGYFASRMTVNMARPTAEMTILQASAESFGETFFLAACIAGAGLISSLFLRKPKHQEAEAKDGK
ncbi:DHA2 family efflux MFS transporter permease subunit [Paenibacillus dendritiformis]|uniref:DHA2 family efflux MFS transporter permease subunit n=1 Tax=Paenibacillus dendritiformis TaxID=130049 RepID=UPI00143E004A|nr:DHA2 family efflux MFS transporter permease subunit [Paenibacillus dendritiformis]NKI24758.1 DHA2 family efflux MFS transporter permease subunit [Paenibacillus dendritiformis]NRF99195.1 DHA2 family efflux MFS transporter permease subunit [Paenibacillus dendritiformis]